MSKSKYKYGHWKACDLGGKNKAIAKCGLSPPESHIGFVCAESADLIATAPELLKALEDAHRVIRTSDRRIFLESSKGIYQRELIARAKGETSE